MPARGVLPAAGMLLVIQTHYAGPRSALRGIRPAFPDPLTHDPFAYLIGLRLHPVVGLAGSGRRLRRLLLLRLPLRLLRCGLLRGGRALRRRPLLAGLLALVPEHATQEATPR